MMLQLFSFAKKAPVIFRGLMQHHLQNIRRGVSLSFCLSYYIPRSLSYFTSMMKDATIIVTCKTHLIIPTKYLDIILGCLS